MLSNLCYPIPTIGRISIGHMSSGDTGRRRPVRLDHFNITTKYKENGEWVLHKAHQAVAKQAEAEIDAITAIPVKVLFNDPNLTIRERNEAYHEGNLVCASNKSGQARQVCDNGIKTVSCPGPEACHFARTCSHGCDVMGRINLQIDVPDAEQFGQDAFSTFIMRTRGYNSVQTVRQKLEMARGMLPSGIVGVSFELRLKKKSSPGSKNTPFYYVDLALACSLEEAAKASKDAEQRMIAMGVSQAGMEAAVLKGLENGMFEDSTEEMTELEDLLVRGEDSPGEVVRTKAPLVLVSEAAINDETLSIPEFVGTPEGEGAANEALPGTDVQPALQQTLSVGEEAPLQPAAADSAATHAALPSDLDALRAYLEGSQTQGSAIAANG